MEKQKVGALEVKNVECEHNPEKRRESKGEGKGSRSSSSPRGNSLVEGAPKGPSLSRRENQPTCLPLLKG